MAKTIGSFETIAAVQAAFDQELYKQYKLDYDPGGKWDKAYGFETARVLATFLGAVQVRLRKKFAPHASKLKLEPTPSELNTLFAQRVDQTVIWAHATLIKVLSVNPDAKLI